LAGQVALLAKLNLLLGETRLTEEPNMSGKTTPELRVVSRLRLPTVTVANIQTELDRLAAAAAELKKAAN